MVEAVLLGFCMENLAAEKKTEFDLCLASILKLKLEINNKVNSFPAMVPYMAPP